MASRRAGGGEIAVDFFALPLAVQARHLPLLVAWFKREHEAEIAGVLARLGAEDGG